MRTVGVRITATLAVLGSTFVPAGQAAAALEPGVHVDPGSPAAKEYALPLSQARGTGSTSSPQTGPEGTLFGAGITPPGSGGSPRGPGAGSGRATPGANPAGPAASGKPSGRGAGAGSADAPAVTQAVLRAAREQGSSGSGSTLALLGGAVAVLVLGGFGGTVLRHSRRPPSSA
jgi:hypothetical protein